MGKKKQIKKKERNKIKRQLKKKTLKMKGTISKKQFKKLNRVLEKNNQIPELEAVRKTCNHHFKGDNAVIEIASFREKYPEKVQYVKDLDKYIEVFGEENVGICQICLTPVVNPAYISVDDLDRAQLMIAAAVEIIKMNKKLEKKEFKLFYDAVQSIRGDVKEVRKLYGKVLNKLDVSTNSAAPGSVSGKNKKYADAE